MTPVTVGTKRRLYADLVILAIWITLGLAAMTFGAIFGILLQIDRFARRLDNRIDAESARTHSHRIAHPKPTRH